MRVTVSALSSSAFQFPAGAEIRRPVPRTRTLLIVRILLATGLFSGCSSQQLYTLGQSWQRANCNRYVENGERARCNANANVPYSTFERQAQEREK